MTSRVEISKRLVLINTASGILARVLYVSVVLWVNAHLLRRISAEEYSLWPMLMSIIVLLPLLTSFLTTGLGRFILAAYAQGDDRQVTQIVSTMFPLLSAAGVLLLTGGLALAWHIDKILLIAPERLWEARIMMALLVFSTAVKPFCAPFNVGFYVQQKFVAYNVINVCAEFLRISLLFLLLFLLGTRVLWVVVANVATELAVTLSVFTWSRRMIPALRFRVREIRWARARELLLFGGWNFLGLLALRLRETVVLGLMNRLATPLDVDVFSVGYQGRRQIDAWTDVMAGPLYPVVTSMHAVGAKEQIRNIYLRGGRLALWMMLLVGLPAAIYAQPLIRLYATEPYIEAATIMVLTLAGLPLSGGIWMIWQVANGTGRVRATSLAVVTTQVAVVALSAYVVYVLGLGGVGVALACLIVGMLSEVLLLWPLGLKLSGATFNAWARETLAPGLTPGCVAGVVWAALNVATPPDSWVGLGACTAAGVLVYLVVLLAFCLEPRDREDLAEVIARLKQTAQLYLGAPQPVSMSAGASPRHGVRRTPPAGPRA
jgi:O-antigen/teichoic acid export membrane protein